MLCFCVCFFVLCVCVFAGVCVCVGFVFFRHYMLKPMHIYIYRPGECVNILIKYIHLNTHAHAYIPTFRLTWAHARTCLNAYGLCVP